MQLDNKQILDFDSSQPGSGRVGPPMVPIVALVVAISAALAMLPIASATAWHVVGYVLAGVVAPVFGILFRHTERTRRRDNPGRFRPSLAKSRIVVFLLVVGTLVAVAHAWSYLATTELAS